MKIIISPAKKMNVDTDTMPWQALPQFLPQTEQILQCLQQMTSRELQALWKCNDKLAALNVERLQGMNLYRQLTPALLAYEGIQYRCMAPSVFTDREFQYVQEHLRILSGFYGLLRPFDGVVPYRLEMQAALSVNGEKNLYSFWGDRLARSLAQETDCIINLASKEYSQCISPYLPEHVRFITCVFAENQNGRLVEKGTLCKMARGEMVRFLAEQEAKQPECMKDFTGQQHRFSPEYSNESTYIFVR